MAYLMAIWQALPKRDAYVLRCPHCGKPLLLRLHGHEETGFFLTFVYVDRYKDRYWRKDSQTRQRPNEKKRRVKRLPQGVVITDTEATGARVGFELFGEEVLQKVLLRIVRRIECGFCSQRMDVPPYEAFAPTLPDLNVWPR